MTLKYEFNKVPNPEYDEAAIKRNLKSREQIKQAIRQIKFQDIKANAYLNNAKSSLDKNLKYINSELKTLKDEPKFLKEVRITSNKKWTLYPEYIGEDCGRTQYSKPEIFTVDKTVPYTKRVQVYNEDEEPALDDDGNPIYEEVDIKGALKAASDKALAKLKEYRKKRKEIQFIEREFNVQGLPFKPKYKVYIGNGNGGPALTYKYVDAWRYPDGIEYTKPEQNDNYFIHLEGGTFLKLQEAARTRRVFEPKKPRTSDHHVGIELEFISKMDKFELATELVKEQLQDFVCLKDDGSIKFYNKNGEATDRPIDDFKYKHELTMVAPEQLVHEVIKRMLRAINRDGKSKVGARCGFHVHLDMRNRDKSLVFHNLSKAQRILYAMNPNSRITGIDSKGKKDTVWSKKIDTADFEEAQRLTSGDRYYGVNIAALNTHQTIEIRIHTGSTNEEKISNWVRILTTIANMSTRVSVEAQKAETFCEYYGLDDKMVAYINQRINKFKDKDGKHITVDEVA
jgi:hypothetical protein